MLDAVDESNLPFFEDLVDDPVVAATGHGQPFELAEQSLAESPRILCDRSEQRTQSRLPDLVWQLVQMSETFGSDLDPIHRGFSDLVSEGQSLPTCRLLARTPDRRQVSSSSRTELQPAISQV